MSPPVGAPRAGTVARVAAIPDNGVLRYTLDNSDTNSGTSVDSWGSNDGTINGATTGVSGANQTYTTNEAYSFDGTDDYIAVPDGTFSFFTNAYTITMWLKPDSVSDGYLFVPQADADMWVNYNPLGNGKIQHHIYDGSSYNAISSTTLSTGTWYFVAAPFDGSLAEIYVDGSKESEASGGLISKSTSPNAIGGLVAENKGYFPGDIDDVRVYDKALSATEISNLYNTGSING